MCRAADRDNDLILTFVLRGLGEAWIDDVTVAVLDTPGRPGHSEHAGQFRRLPPTHFYRKPPALPGRIGRALPLAPCPVRKNP